MSVTQIPKYAHLQKSATRTPERAHHLRIVTPLQTRALLLVNAILLQRHAPTNVLDVLKSAI